MKKYKNILNAILYLLFYMILHVMVQICFVIFAQGNGEDTEQFINNSTLMWVLVSNILFIISLAVFFRIRRKRLLHEINARSVSTKLYPLPIVCAFCYSVAVSMIFYNVTFTNSRLISNSTSYYSSIMPGSGGLLCIFSVLVLSPVTEEILFRGLLMTRLKRSVSVKASIIISSLLFGAVHMAAGGFALAVSACISGFIFGLVFEKTRSLLPAIAAHAAANIPDFLIDNMPNLTNTMRYTAAACFFVLFVISFIAVMKKNKEMR